MKSSIRVYIYGHSSQLATEASDIPSFSAFKPLSRLPFKLFLRRPSYLRPSLQ